MYVRLRGTLGLALACVVLGVAAHPAEAGSAPANSGRPGSSCAAAIDRDGRYTAPGPGVSTSGLGADAPGYYEVGAPTGRYAGLPPKAIMLVIHPGGWFLVGKEVLAHWGRPMADRWRGAGWQTVTIDYRACDQSIGDVLWFMARLRYLHPHSVICATGSSAGGHLAMLLAAMRPDLACAISHAGPTDLLDLDHQFTSDAGGHWTDAGPKLVSNYARAAFGPDALLARSPRQQAAKIAARVLLATGQTDPLIPGVQDQNFAKALRLQRPGGYVDVLALPPGDQYFVHTYVTKQSLQQLRVREDALVAPLLARSQVPLGG
jgi:acetyl esterase/lipase